MDSSLMPESSVPPEEEKEPVFINGWKIYDWTDPRTKDVCHRAYDALDRAEQKNGQKKYENISLLATQIVSGTNYCIFCRETEADPMRYLLVYVYEDNSGGADIISTQPLMNKDMLKNFVVNTESIDITAHSEVAEAFLEADQKRKDTLIYTGLGYLGKYVEDGQLKSYMVFCRVRDKSKGVKNPLYFASVSIDISPEGEATFGTVNQAPIGV